jgi:hypothetical protein
LDTTQPPEVVLEQVAPCRDGAVARAELKSALAPAVAPGAEWKIRARFARSAGHVTAHGDVVNADGVTVASRSLTTDGADCASLAKGLGVWASLVLDTEVERAKASTPADIDDDPLVGPAAARSTSLWPTTTPPDPIPPEADVFLSHAKDKRTVELGLETFVMGGTGNGVLVGPSLYGIFEAAHGFFLRPTLLAGHSIGQLSQSAEAPATFVGSRFDACARLPGMYLEHRGMQLDLCGGGELGFSQVDSGSIAAGPTGSVPSPTQPFLALGPSFGLRGELGSSLSATLRGVADLSLLHDEVLRADGTPEPPSLFAWRAEVGLSWSVR